MENTDIRKVIATINSIVIVEKLALDHGREKINFQQIADLMQKTTF